MTSVSLAIRAACRVDAIEARSALRASLRNRWALEASAENAARNGLSDRLALHEGPLETAPPGRFGLVVANMIRSELFPLLPGLRARCAAGGTVILSGLLEEEEGRARARAELNANLDPRGPMVNLWTQRR